MLRWRRGSAEEKCKKRDSIATFFLERPHVRCNVAARHFLRKLIFVWNIGHRSNADVRENVVTLYVAGGRGPKYTRWKMLRYERFKRYWLRRKKKFCVNGGRELCWLDHFVRDCINSFCRNAYEVYAEIVRAWILTCCVASVPVVFLGTACLATVRIMAPNRCEGLRFCCELALLLSMWQGSATNIVALLAWAS